MKRFLPLFLTLALLIPAFPAAMAAEGETPARTIYVMEPGESVDLDLDDFRLLCRQKTGHELESITFSALPGQVGELFYRHGRSDSVRVTADTVCRVREDTSLVFGPNDKFTGQADLAFTMTSTRDETAPGTVTFLASPPTADLVLDGEAGTSIDPALLSELCKKKTGAPLRWVSFDPAEHLRYDRGEGDVIPATRRMEFYVDPAEGRDLAKVSFDPFSEGSLPYIYISASGRSTAGEIFNATLRMELKSFEEGSVCRYGAVGEPIPLEGILTGGYDASVILTLPDSNLGTLWLNYGEPEEQTKLLPGRELTKEELSGLTYVPAPDWVGTVQLDLTIFDEKGEERAGVLALISAVPRDAEPAQASTKRVPVEIHRELYQACAARELGSLEKVSFPTLPDPAQGTVTWGNDPVEAGKFYEYYALGFTPGESFAGGVDLDYTATDNAGFPFSGTLTLSYGYPSSARFEDLEGWDWAFVAAEDLSRRGGLRWEEMQGAFRPGDAATRMEVIYALVKMGYGNQIRAAERHPEFTDLPADADYANAAAVAIEQGIVQGDGKGHLSPDAPVTRQDALVLLYRTLLKRGRTFSGSGDLAAFSDAGELAPYAEEAVSALLGAGILQGSDRGELAPGANITRAEMAVLVYRAFRV